MPKTGRPKSDNPKDVRFTVRFDALLNEKLEQYSAENNITVAEAVRRAVKKLLRMK